MIFSQKHDFLFIKGRKVAGTSVEMALATICGPQDIISRITPIDELERLRRGGRGAQNYSRSPTDERDYLKSLTEAEPGEIRRGRSRRELYVSHMSLREFVDAYGLLPTERIFCVERSPYAKIISKTVMSAGFAKYRRTGENMSLDLKALRFRIGAQMERPDVLETCKNIDLYRRPDGGMSTRVLRNEALAEEFANLMNEYGILPTPELPHAKQGLNSNSIDPCTVFDRKHIDRINEVFAEEFDTFGYERL